MSFIGKKIKCTKIPKIKRTFLIKLYTILEDNKYSDYIQWSDNGKSFIIFNKNDFLEKSDTVSF